MGGYERSGLKFDNVGPTFSSLTMLPGGKWLKLIDLLQIEFMPICRLKVVLFISECTLMILAKFARNLKDLSWYCSFNST